MSCFPALTSFLWNVITAVFWWKLVSSRFWIGLPTVKADCSHSAGWSICYPRSLCPLCQHWASQELHFAGLNLTGRVAIRLSGWGEQTRALVLLPSTALVSLHPLQKVSKWATPRGTFTERHKITFKNVFVHCSLLVEWSSQPNPQRWIPDNI